MNDKMKRLFCLAALPAFAAAAATVSNVQMETSPDRLVTISYDLDGDAVVTADVLTNGVSIGRGNLTFMAGAVNRKIASGAGRKIYWAADKAWPGFRFDDSEVSVEVTAWADDNPPDWMVLDVQDTSVTNIAFYCSDKELPGGAGARLYKTDRLLMRRVHARNVEWMMGSPTNEVGRGIDSRMTMHLEPCRRVTLTNDYYLGVYEVTQAQMLNATGNRKSNNTTDDDVDTCPADAVTAGDLRGGYNTVGTRWPDSGHEVVSTSAIAKFREKTGTLLDLPTSAQWEFACRAGSSAALYSGRNLNSDTGVDVGVDELAWYGKNSGGTTHPVGGKKANAWGFYDMYGNVWEYVLDGEYSDSTVYSDAQPEIEPVGPTMSEAKSATATQNTRRLYRGGAKSSYAAHCRSAMIKVADVWYASEMGARGFRLAAPAVVPAGLKGE